IKQAEGDLRQIFLILLALNLMPVAPSIAGEAQGAITAVNAKAMTVTLDNGEIYALPDEFDVSLISPGMVVALAHEDDSAKTVTDMELVD
ncbi:MAG: DUF1344 domain-containing protein, partial [Pseudomonadota bacterium]